jgi:hypothetical protein
MIDRRRAAEGKSDLPFSLAETRQRYIVEARPLDANTAASLRADPHAGARTILAKLSAGTLPTGRRARLRKLLRDEGALWESGILRVAGVRRPA